MSQSVAIGTIGSFPNPYKDVKKKLADQISGRWAPDSEDFQAVLSQSAKAKGSELAETGNYGQFLVSLAFSFSKKDKTFTRRPEGSVSRVDLITHADTSIIGLAGEITLPKSPIAAPTVSFTPNTPPRGKIGLLNFFAHDAFLSIEDDDPENASVRWAKRNSSGKIISQGPPVTLNDCIKSFAKNARLVCYACHGAGASFTFRSEILQGLADLLGIEVGGFTTLIKYTFKQGKGITLSLEDDKGTQHGTPSSDYRDLDDNPDVFKVCKPQSKSGNPQTPQGN